MTDYFDLSPEDKSALLNNAVQQTGRRAEVIEKDIWVCWALDTLFNLPDSPRMAFKGGTSLSKAYQAINRFSEDVDVTIDYRDLDPSRPPLDDDLSNTKRKQLSDELRSSAATHVRNIIQPWFQEAAARVNATVKIDESGEELRVFYPSAINKDRGYLREEILSKSRRPQCGTNILGEAHGYPLRVQSKEIQVRRQQAFTTLVRHISTISI